jgi:tellurite resistance protein TerC
MKFFLASAVPSDLEALFQQSLAAFSRITPVEILVFSLPFIMAVLVDLLTHRHGKKVTWQNAAGWSVIWILCSVAFALFVWRVRDIESASLYLTGYVLEKALAVDNLFAFYLIFKSFGLTTETNQPLQHRILYWGILGAILLRVFFLGMGSFIVNVSPYVLILFATVVLWTVWKMWGDGGDDEEVDYTRHWSVLAVRKISRVNPSIASGRFFHNGVTPLFLCLVCIEVCDVVFAFDSMPVVVAVVRDPYLMIASSLWAAAGLRSLYFLLVAAQNMFWALDKAVLVLLVLVAGKLIGSAFHWHVPNVVSLTIVVSVLGSGILWSLAVKNPDEEEAA